MHSVLVKIFLLLFHLSIAGHSAGSASFQLVSKGKIGPLQRVAGSIGLNMVGEHPKLVTAAVEGQTIAPKKSDTEEVLWGFDMDQLRRKGNALLGVFIIALLGGLLTVFTPYVYAFVPMTIGTIVSRSSSSKEGHRHTAMFIFFIISIFTMLGLIISVIFGSTGLNKLTANWIFNLFFCRFLAGLGLSMLGAFEIKLPMGVIRATHNQARNGNLVGIFFMALTLPVVTFSSTFPLMGLILVMAGRGGVAGPLVGMLGFSIGLSGPFIYPRLINLMPSSVLNYIKVLFGFMLVFLGIKFFSNADIAIGWHILDRNMFILIWIVMCMIVGGYMLGWVKLSNDYVATRNVYGQESVSYARLFLAILSFSFAVFLLPGLWGAPLKGLSAFLPPMF